MKKNIILILLSDQRSTSETIILKSMNFLKNKKNIYLFIGSSFFFKELPKNMFVINNFNDLNKKKINFYDINKNYKSLNQYINTITNEAINLLKKRGVRALINMPLNKKILGKKTIGFTEFFSKKLNQFGKETMLIYNEDLSACPLTTHIPVRNITKFINKEKIINTVNNINSFYKKIIKKKINIKLCGLNPHSSVDSFDKNNEEKKIIIPTLKKINKNNKNVSGPYSADTVFFKSNNTVIIGMYHDQVLPAFKAIKGFNAINITIGLKYLRMSPDHGTGLDILNNKKKINNQSFKYCIKFCEKYLNV